MQDELQSLIHSHGLNDVTLVLVPSVHEWLIANKIASDNPFRQASFVHRHDGTLWIVVLEEVTSDHPGQTTLFFHVEREEYAWITSDLTRFARHLVLHEIAHAVLRTTDETLVDQWTVPELRKLEARP